MVVYYAPLMDHLCLVEMENRFLLVAIAPRWAVESLPQTKQLCLEALGLELALGLEQ
jgi:hypothetical protein